MTLLGWFLFLTFLTGLIAFVIAAFKLAGDADALDQRRRDLADRPHLTTNEGD